ncbi:MAG TPA: hypothetical protein VF494_04690 [Candidatus Limnocylindrales bacterium]
MSCYTAGTQGSLTADPEVGTLIHGEPVKWPWGFTARRDGSEVQVLGWLANVVATTGRSYYLPGGNEGDWFEACRDALPAR